MLEGTRSLARTGSLFKSCARERRADSPSLAEPRRAIRVRGSGVRSRARTRSPPVSLRRRSFPAIQALRAGERDAHAEEEPHGRSGDGASREAEVALALRALARGPARPRA